MNDAIVGSVPQVSTSGSTCQRVARSLAVAVLMGTFTTITHAGVVLFDPPVQEFHINALPQSASFDLTVVAEELSRDGGATHEFQGLDLYLQNDFGYGTFELPILAFRIQDAIVDNAAIISGPFRCGIAGCEWGVGAFAIQPYESPLLLGTLEVDLSGIQGTGDYRLEIENESGFNAIGLDDQTESLSGLGIVRITPEPTTVLLILTGLLALTRRSPPISRA